MAHYLKRLLVWCLVHLWLIWGTGAEHASKILTRIWRGFPAA